MLANPVIVIPGITASSLRDEYPLEPELVWSIARRALDRFTNAYERVTLHPENPLYEAVEPSLIRSDGVFGLVYGQLIEELRHDLRPSPKEEVPVFPFSYDWRQPLDLVVLRLKAFIDEIIDRTLLMRHYFNDANFKANPRVNLIGHSMGGLLIAGVLKRYGSKARVDKVTTIATPFQGSAEAPVKIVAGTGDLGTGQVNPREREASRLTPALYYLFPRYDNAVIDEDKQAYDLFDVSNIEKSWQPNVLESIVQTVKAYQLDESTAPEQLARRAFTTFLDQARSFLNDTDQLDLKTAIGSPDNWLCIAGVGRKTRVQLNLKKLNGKVNLDLRTKDFVDHWTIDRSDQRTGDGTVPFPGACPRFMDRNRMVCVSPDDFGFWEFADKGLAIEQLGGFHGMLPRMSLVHRLITLHFLGKQDKYDNVWGRRAPGVLSGDWNAPIQGLTDETVD